MVAMKIRDGLEFLLGVVAALTLEGEAGAGGAAVAVPEGGIDEQFQ